MKPSPGGAEVVHMITPRPGCSGQMTSTVLYFVWVMWTSSYRSLVHRSGTVWPARTMKH